MNELPDNIYAPFKNGTVYCLMTWHHDQSTTKSRSELDHLVCDMINYLEFKAEYLEGFRFA